VIRRHGTELRALLAVADAAVVVALLLGLSLWRFGPDWPTFWRQSLGDPVVFVSLYAATWVALLAVNGLYRPRARWSIRSEVRDVLRATATMVVITLSVLFLAHLPDVSRLFLVALFPSQALATIAVRGALRLTFEWLRERGYNVRYIVIVGSGLRGQLFAQQIENHRGLGLRVLGFLGDHPPADASRLRWPYLGSIEDLETVLHDRVVDEVAICLPFKQWDLIDSIAALCEEEGKIVRLPMDAVERTIARARLEELDGVPVFSLVSGPDRAVSLAAKRAIDVVAAATGLIVLSPLLLICAAAVAIDDGMPILFRQRRLGLHGRPFVMVKFRSMARGAEAARAAIGERNELNGRAFKITDDPRITRVGRWLRRISLDELPQLWNVLWGQMSLVGPRPPLPDEVAEYDLWHRRRLSMKPGITGLWQVRGRRDPDFNNWVTADLEYIDKWSLMLDLRILARTIPAALQGR
jgi:exopolysaccharide biosynthesis polyprenyl glycosylphosphotransferase